MEKAEKDEKQKLSVCVVPTRRAIENSKKIEKKFRKYKNTIVASFQAIIGWNRLRNKENKNYNSASFQPDALEKNHKKMEKNSKNSKNTVMASFQAKIGWKRPRKRENTN